MLVSFQESLFEFKSLFDKRFLEFFIFIIKIYNYIFVVYIFCTKKIRKIHNFSIFIKIGILIFSEFAKNLNILSKIKNLI